ncbi:MAG: class I SAM-dependent methyltransferase [Nocardioidaceae bacterium]
MTEPGYFDGLYAGKDDPWDLSGSPYERRKLDVLMASLPRPRYRDAFEPGCAIGVTTCALAKRCDRLLAMDGAASAVAQTRSRLAGVAPHVRVIQGRLPDDWPDGSFDLIVLSELLYYLDAASRRQIADRIRSTAAADADVMVVHWRHPFTEATTTGDQAHRELTAGLRDAGFRRLVHHVEDDFQLQVHRASAEASIEGTSAEAR